MTLRLLLILIFFLPLSIYAQDKAEKKRLASEYYNKGVALRYTHKDSAYHYLNKALKYSYELAEYSDVLEMVIQAIFISGQYSDMKENRFYLNRMETILGEDSVKNNLDYLEYYQNRFIYEKGSYLFTLKEYDGAKKQFLKVYRSLGQKAIPLLEVHDLLILVHTTNFLASVYMDTGKYDLAKNYFEQSLAFVEQNKLGKEEGLDRSTNRLLAQLYVLTGQHALAHKTLEKLLNEYKLRYKENTRYKNSLITVYQRSVKNLMLQDSLNKALDYLDESQKYLIADDPFVKHAFLLYGDIHSKLGQDEQALDNYQKALIAFGEFRQQRTHQDIANVYGKMAELYLKQKNYTDGLETIKKAFNNAGKDIEITDIRENPNPADVFSKTQLLHLFDIKLQLLQGNYEKTNESTLQLLALNTCRDIIKTFDLLKSEFESKLDKQFLAEKAYPIFHRMLQTAHMAFEKERSPLTLQLALNIAEKNRDFILLEAMRDAQATQYGNVPKDVLNKESELRAKITHLEKEIFNATETESGFSDDLFKLKREYYGFLDTVKTKYPKYHNLKYRTTSLDMTVIRDMLLDDNNTLISYTMTDDYLYAIIMNESDGNFLKLPFSNIDREAISDFYSLLSIPSLNGEEKEIIDLGKILFKKILKKPLEGFETENLTIIPDGELHYLPFAMLRLNGSYLVQTKNIGYGNSVTSLIELQEKEPAKRNRILAVAPSFDDDIAETANRQFGKLVYNDEEVKNITPFFETEAIIDQSATLENFRSKAPLFNVIHLATHASANDEYPDYSYLAFSKNRDSSESNILYIKDLYNTTLNADMVTLSACQTGIGKLQKGQGMLSLSKGFYYAGAKSLVNTLWKINDKSSVRLMEFFYKGLSEGKSKTEALRDAKLNYLETTEDDLLKHPYYWSAFVVSGDSSPITNTNNWWYVGALFLFFGVIYFVTRKSTKR
ncbi:MAG: CHAT domain-containing protein [Pricia sp.]|nr:CHAT domain-containing protein [Pricia sp.]